LKYFLEFCKYIKSPYKSIEEAPDVGFFKDKFLVDIFAYGWDIIHYEYFIFYEDIFTKLKEILKNLVIIPNLIKNYSISEKTVKFSKINTEYLISGEISLKFDYSVENLFLFIFLFLVVILGLKCIPKLLSPKIFYIEKLTSYECGFAPFSKKSIANELHFLVVGIIFLIFDLEIIYIVPLILGIGSQKLISIAVIYFILIIITVYIELSSGAVSWPI